MRSSDEILNDANDLLRMDGRTVDSYEIIKTFCHGRGQIVKILSGPLQDKTSIRSWQTSKMIMKRLLFSDDPWRGLAFQVEICFQSSYATMLRSDIPVAEFLASGGAGEEGEKGVVMLTEDLEQKFPVAGVKLEEEQVYAALAWLARFHAFWWKEGTFQREDVRRTLRGLPIEGVEIMRGEHPDEEGVWLHGGGSIYAAEHRENLKRDAQWSQLFDPVTKSGKSIADLVTQLLSSEASPLRPYQTLIHGSTYAQNILFSHDDPPRAAFLNFQSCGLGLGAQDLAVFFTSCVPSELLEGAGEERLLESYRVIIKERSGLVYEMKELERHFELALLGLFLSDGRDRVWLERRIRRILANGQWVVRMAGEQEV